MPESLLPKLKIVDGIRLPVQVRSALMPGGKLRDSFAHARTLPRFFYEIPTWEVAQQTPLTAHFSMWEFIQTDVREAESLRGFPRYVPCAITLLATALQRLRDAAGGPVRLSANGGYRSPRHALTCRASLHCWGSAADIYCVGTSNLDSPELIEKYAALARDVIPGVWTHPVGHGAEETDDHLHLDLGFAVSVPHHVRVDSTILAEVAP